LSTYHSDAELISDTESVGEPEVPKPAENREPSEEECTPEQAAKAEEFKEKGNALFKGCKFEQAIDMYTESIFCKVSPKQKAIYYCNRALANLKMENFSFSLFDSCESIKLTPKTPRLITDAVKLTWHCDNSKMRSPIL